MRELTVALKSPVGEFHQTIPFPTSSTKILRDVITEAIGTLAPKIYAFSVTTGLGGYILTENDLQLTVGEAVDKCGAQFLLLDGALVNKRRRESDPALPPHEPVRFLDEVLLQAYPLVPEGLVAVTPKHPGWEKRVKYEGRSLSLFMQQQKTQPHIPWCRLRPKGNPDYRYLVWEGAFVTPARREIQFDARVLLTSEYPQVAPRCFVERRVLKYAHSISPHDTWRDPETQGEYVMINTPGATGLETWNQTFGLVHYLLQEVWVWLALQQDFIIREYDRQKTTRIVEDES